jgi:G:T-mismatch repair DNA endonuclease (very short patch repair protein)
MKNIIQIDGKIVREYRIGNSKANPSKYILEDGSEVVKPDIRAHNIKIQCSGDQSWYSIKSITSVHLNRSYFGRKWYGIHQNPFRGKHHSDELKRRLSDERTGTWCIGKNNAMYGKTNYDVWVEKFGVDKAVILESNRRKKFSKSISGSSNPFYGKHHRKDTIDAMRSKCKNWFSSLSTDKQSEYRTVLSNAQRKLQSNDPIKYRLSKVAGGKASMLSQMPNWVPNKIETIVQRELSNRGLVFEFGVILDGLQFDFGNKQHKILLEVQGDYWHGNPTVFGPNKRPLNTIQLAKMSRDVTKEKFCVQHGFTLFKIWEMDIKAENFGTLDQIRDLIRSKL